MKTEDKTKHVPTVKHVEVINRFGDVINGRVLTSYNWGTKNNPDWWVELVDSDNHKIFFQQKKQGGGDIRFYEVEKA